tara:strand:- start:1820 stop:3046 length:1227 start_codon:yes stop_codon:yes gene_type:complete
MANFDDQVMGLTGLTISGGSSAPSQSELTQFLTDGAKEIINILPPNLKEKAMSITNLYIGNTATIMDLDGKGEIFYVTRENADSGVYAPCRKINAMYGDLTNDSENIIYGASATDPVYYVESNSSGNSTLFVKPTPTAAQPAKVYHISYPTVAYNDGGTIANFPDEVEYLVVLYAACKSLQSALGGFGISTFSLSASAPADVPSAPSISGGSVGAITIDALPSAPNYTAPVFSSASTYLTEMEAGTIGNAASDIDVEHWFSIAGQLIEDEEDTELAQVHLQKISTFLNAFSQDMQNQLNIFNEGNAVYQAAIQRNLEQARINMQDAQKEADLTLQASIQDYTLELQRVSASVSRYQTLVQQEVQTYQQEIAEKSTEYKWMTQQYQMLKQDYMQGLSSLGISQGQKEAK